MSNLRRSASSTSMFARTKAFVPRLFVALPLVARTPWFVSQKSRLVSWKLPITFMKSLFCMRLPFRPINPQSLSSPNPELKEHTMNIHRMSAAAKAFLCLTLVGRICLAQKDLNPNDPVISDAAVEKPEKPAASVSSEADRDSVASITLKKLDPVQVANTLRNLFVKEGSHTPSIEADEEHRKIIVRGTEEEINQVRTILRELGETTASSEELQRLSKNSHCPTAARSMAEFFHNSGPPSNRIEGLDVLLIETKDGLSGYSKSLGEMGPCGRWFAARWSTPPEDGDRLALFCVRCH